jgi:ABC-type transport system substrate-binding protein
MGTAKINGELQRSTTMRIKLTYITPLLAAAAAAVAISAAPTAAAANGQTCSGNICQSPGNVQINNTPPLVQYYPYGTMPFLLGGHGGGLLGGLF